MKRVKELLPTTAGIQCLTTHLGQTGSSQEPTRWCFNASKQTGIKRPGFTWAHSTNWEQKKKPAGVQGGRFPSLAKGMQQLSAFKGCPEADYSCINPPTTTINQPVAHGCYTELPSPKRPGGGYSVHCLRCMYIRERLLHSHWENRCSGLSRDVKLSHTFRGATNPQTSQQQGFTVFPLYWIQLTGQGEWPKVN